MKKAVIFDLDGTVSDTLSTITHYCNITMEYCGFKKFSEDKIRYFVGNGKKVLIHRMLEFYNADTEENFKKAEKKYDYEYENDVIYKTKPFDGITEMLSELKKHSIKTAVLSNKPDNVTVMIVNELFGGFFDVAHGKMDNVKTKPDPESTFYVMNELGVSADECFFVGDTNVDIFTAKNAGIDSIGVLWGFRDKKELEEAGADYIIEHPDQICDILFKNFK